ncbi:alpha-N-arabinofuranosidase [Lactobacillus sp. ESL0703]|uniref:arabinosylfuranosidase ArfA n=1 Tax=Lactobacillus sp. ESL0703 TaxID=2983218 RepID=UPI0023F622A3|nr:alpha-N-arabinofuranosidase [Lactobacillus sp. ESL0703]MDF7669093.1 alpha-N-arabinofuranosidase [Lactobacillus sp. ESL0703]
MLKASFKINSDNRIGKIDPRMWGSLTEQLGRGVYTGIYQPDHPLADENGFRKDVVSAIKKLNVPLIRYPGGNFVSGYNWEDGIGPKEERPVKLDLAWKSIETNQFGLHEFMKWCQTIGAQADMAINLGTRGIDSARNLVEYCNFPKGTYLSDLRIKNGQTEPFNIKLWSLGNEMDGEWQIGHKTVTEYGRLAHETAKAMKIVDPTIELIACGSSLHTMDTFGVWEETILDHIYDDVDYLSLHQYYDNDDHDIKKFLSSSVDLDSLINDVIAICDAVKARKHQNKTMYLAMDEWNVWYHSKKADDKQKPWQIAPPLLEDHYNFADALVVGSLAMVLMNHADRVKIGCLAQLVNVIAPIMTNISGTPTIWLQSIFYPFLQISNYGQGETLRVQSHSESYSLENRVVPYVESSAAYNSAKNEIVLFIENKADKEVEISYEIDDFPAINIIEATQFCGYDLEQTNENQLMRIEELKQVNLDSNRVVGKLEAYSWNMIRLSVKDKG